MCTNFKTRPPQLVLVRLKVADERLHIDTHHVIIAVTLRTKQTSKHSFNGVFASTTWLSQPYKGKTILDFDGTSADGVAAAPAGPYANHSHLASDRQPRQQLITPFLQAGRSF